MSETTASNFELNVLKLGIHTFQLEKGDRFESNGSYFHYIPHKNSPNAGKGKRRRYEGRQNYHSAVKYQKDVLRADNIELVKDELLSVGANGHEHREFKSVELEVERVTEKQLFLKTKDPISYSQRLEKHELNNVRVQTQNLNKFQQLKEKQGY